MAGREKTQSSLRCIHQLTRWANVTGIRAPRGRSFFPYLTPPVLRNDSQYIFIERISYFLLLQWLLIPIYFDFFLWTEISEWISHSTWRERENLSGKETPYILRKVLISVANFIPLHSVLPLRPASFYLSIYLYRVAKSRGERPSRKP